VDERLRVLERIAALALRLRSLEKELIPTKSPRRVMDELMQTRADIDAELEGLAVIERRR